MPVPGRITTQWGEVLVFELLPEDANGQHRGLSGMSDLRLQRCRTVADHPDAQRERADVSEL